MSHKKSHHQQYHISITVLQNSSFQILCTPILPSWTVLWYRSVCTSVTKCIGIKRLNPEAPFLGRICVLIKISLSTNFQQINHSTSFTYILKVKLSQFHCFWNCYISAVISSILCAFAGLQGTLCRKSEKLSMASTLCFMPNFKSFTIFEFASQRMHSETQFWYAFAHR